MHIHRAAGRQQRHPVPPALAVKSVKELIGLAKRFPPPNLPAMQETGVKGFLVSSGFSFLGPGGMAQPVVEKLNTTLVQGLRDPGNRKQLIDRGADPVGSSPAEHAAFI